MNSDSEIRDAATIVLVRQDGSVPRVLMGLRGRNAIFMPDKFVFPGGRVDDADHRVELTPGLAADCAARIAPPEAPTLANALATAAIRELWEETGLKLAHRGNGKVTLPETWAGFGAPEQVPDAGALRFFFRAVTPPGRPRRFDARFFLAPADAVSGDIDDFAGASGELTHLAWVDLARARSLDLPFITEIVLSEIDAILCDPDAARPVPYFHHDGKRSYFSRL